MSNLGNFSAVGYDGAVWRSNTRNGERRMWVDDRERRKRRVVRWQNMEPCRKNLPEMGVGLGREAVNTSEVDKMGWF